VDKATANGGENKFMNILWSAESGGIREYAPRYTHISTHMFDELHLLPLHARIQYKIITGF